MHRDRSAVAGVTLALLALALSTAATAQSAPAARAQTPAEQAKADSGRMPYTASDVVQSWYQGGISVFDWTDAAHAKEIARGLDLFELTPSAFLSQNEIDAAKSVHFEYFNAQEQPKLVWPPTFSLARAFVDQLGRNNGLSASRLTTVSRDLDRAEKVIGSERRSVLEELSAELGRDAGAASDGSKVRLLSGAIRELAAAPR